MIKSDFIFVTTTFIQTKIIMSVTPEANDPVTGLPKVQDVEAARKKGVKNMLMTWGLNHVFMAVGLGVAFLVYLYTGKETYDTKLAAGAEA